MIPTWWQAASRRTTLESRKQYCKAVDKKCSKCQRLHHFASVCRAVPKAASTTTSAETEVTGGLTLDHSPAYFYAMSAPPTQASQLSSYAATLANLGPVTTLPLPHFVHSVHAGWQKQRPQSSPTHPMTIKIDKSCLHIPQVTCPQNIPQGNQKQACSLLS